MITQWGHQDGMVVVEGRLQERGSGDDKHGMRHPIVANTKLPNDTER
ncbi:hypothetical protein [Streptomyces sp. NPDC056549]